LKAVSPFYKAVEAVDVPAQGDAREERGHSAMGAGKKEGGVDRIFNPACMSAQELVTMPCHAE